MGFVRRRARRRTALVVGGAAYAAGKHRSRDQGYDDAAYDEPPPAPPPAAAPAPPPAPPPAAPSASIDYDQLEQLGKLHADGTLTDEEFAAAKAKVLGG
jgi:Short C-terminal domain